MLKKLLILAAIVAIIPMNQKDQKELYYATKATVGDLLGFCGRNPTVCEKGGEAIDKMAVKAEFGAKMVVDIVTENSSGKSDPLGDLIDSHAGKLMPAIKPLLVDSSKPVPARGNERFPSYKSRAENPQYTSSLNTLSQNDLQTGWRGPSQ